MSAIGSWRAVALLASRSHNVRTRRFTAADAPHWRPVPVRVKYRAFRDCVGAEGTSAGPPRRTVMDAQRVPDLRQTHRGIKWTRLAAKQDQRAARQF